MGTMTWKLGTGAVNAPRHEQRRQVLRYRPSISLTMFDFLAALLTYENFLSEPRSAGWISGMSVTEAAKVFMLSHISAHLFGIHE